MNKDLEPLLELRRKTKADEVAPLVDAAPKGFWVWPGKAYWAYCHREKIAREQLGLRRKMGLAEDGRVASVIVAYLVALVSTFTLMSPEGTMFAGVGTKMTAAALMLFFGPYLLPICFTTGFFPGLGPLCGVVAVLPFLAAHIVFLVILSKRIPLWRRLGRFGKSAQKTALVLWALLSAAGVWYEVPVITHYDLVGRHRNDTGN